jgi:ankyrin repeat protein
MNQLIQLGADINLKNANGHTLLHLILLGEKILDYALLAFLVDSGAEVKLPDSCDQTPLSIATERNDRKAFSILLSGCVVNAIVLK